MIKLSKEQQEQYTDFDDEFGVEGDAKTLFEIALNNDVIEKGDRIEPILLIFDIEKEALPHFNDKSIGSVLDINKIKSEPHVLRKLIDKNYDQYMINGYDFEL